jgi:hypothetical protein
LWSNIVRKSKNESPRIPKTLERKLSDLDAHLFLLRTHLEGLQQSYSHIKAIAAELRTLVCLSSGTEGLLHRLVTELGVDDSISLHVPGNFDLEHPLVKSMEFGYAPLWPAGHGPVEIAPDKYSLRFLIKEIDAVLVNGKPLTHEYLIKAVAQQIGTAHEADEVEPALVQLDEVLLNGVGPITQILSLDSELALEIGERILEAAEKKGIQCRQIHDHDFGNVSIVIRLKVIEPPTTPLGLYRFRSHGPGVLIECSVTSSGVEFHLIKHGIQLSKLLIPYSIGEFPSGDLVVVLSYCSKAGQVRTITSLGVVETKECKLGWLHAGDLEISVEDNLAGLVELGFMLTYRRLLSSKEVAKLEELPPDGYGIWRPSDELEAAGPFPDQFTD